MGTNTSALSLNQLAKPSVLWLTFFGAGLLRPAPGTWGSVAALAVWWWGLSEWPALTQGVIAVVYSLVSWWVCAKFLQRTGLHDEPQIVADEVAGLWLALLFVPVTWWAGLLAFALFRLFDITKPSPYRMVRSQHQGRPWRYGRRSGCGFDRRGHCQGCKSGLTVDAAF